MSERLHETTPEGEEKHWFEKVDGVWVCDCGERRDCHGKPLAPRLMKA